MGGSDTKTVNATQSVDSESQRKMAEIAQQNQDIANQQWGLYQNVFQPYDEAMIQANMDLLPQQKALSQAQLESQLALNPLYQQATQAGLEEMLKDIELTRPLKEAQVQSQLSEIEASDPAMQKFYQEALEGVNAEDRMGQATADVAGAYKDADAVTRRAIARTGASPNAGQYASLAQDLAMERAKATGAARTNARTTAEQENFGRLTTAMGARGSNDLAGVGSTATGASGASSQANSIQNYGGYNISNPADRISSMFNTALNATNMGATRNSTQDMEYKQNPWTAVGQIGGTMAGAWASSKQGG